VAGWVWVVVFDTDESASPMNDPRAENTELYFSFTIIPPSTDHLTTHYNYQATENHPPRGEKFLGLDPRLWIRIVFRIALRFRRRKTGEGETERPVEIGIENPNEVETLLV